MEKKFLIGIESDFHDIYHLLYNNGTQEEIYKFVESLAKNAQQLKESFHVSADHK